MSDITNSEPSESAQSLPCMILPIQGGELLVPSVTIAEVASVAPIFPDNSGPDWFLGHYSWRNKRVPLISYEKLTRDHGGGINPNGRIVLFHNTGDNSEIGFLAIPTQGVPQEVNVSPDDLNGSQGNVPLSAYETLSVKVAGEEMVIPNMAALENAYLEYKDHLL